MTNTFSHQHNNNHTADMSGNTGFRGKGVLIGTLFLIGCSASADRPPEIVPDKYECGRCRMLISDGMYAAARKTDNTYALYDDIGCMLSALPADQSEAGIWVRDYNENRWVEAEQAEFYMLMSKNTPMGYGYIARKKNITKPSEANEMTIIGDFRKLRSAFDNERMNNH